MRLWEGQPFSFENFVVMSLQLATVRVSFFTFFEVPTFRLWDICLTFTGLMMRWKTRN